MNDQSVQDDYECDCAIVGGGVSGLYAGWRLLTGDGSSCQGKKVALFEMSNRLGGRLLSWLPFGGDGGLRAELGGMRFYSAAEDQNHKLKGHQLVHNLVDHLGLETQRFYTHDNPDKDHTILYLRGKRTRYQNPDLTVLKKLYKLQRAEQKSPDALLNDVISEVVAKSRLHLRLPDLDPNWMSWDREDWDNVKPFLTYDGQKLWRWGFWNLLSTILSYEGYQYLIDALGYYSVIHNWNAAEALSFVAQDFAVAPDYLTLKDGYGQLATILSDEFLGANGATFLNHQLIKFEKDGNGHFLLHFYWRADGTFLEAGGETPSYKIVRTRKLILALPYWSLKQLQSSNAYDLLSPGGIRQHINAVVGVPAFKLILLYEKRWWEDEDGGGIDGAIYRGHSVCDLPIRQTYYFKPDDDAKDNGQGLLMVSYDDGETVDYWKGMEEPHEDKEEGRKQLIQRINDSRLSLSFSGLMMNSDEHTPNSSTSSPWLRLPFNVYKAPEPMIQRAVEQVALLHGKDAYDPTLWPKIGVYADWSLEPFGGGWNFWRPQFNALHVMERLATKSMCCDEDGHEYRAYIVGEAYCGLQGWVEGTLTATEVVLENNFELKRPHWLPERYYLGPGSTQTRTGVGAAGAGDPAVQE